MKEYLTFEAGNSNKFWSIETTGKSFTVTFGKIGSSGSSKKKSFDSKSECEKEAQKLLKEKLKKGYVASSDGAASSGSAAAPAAKASKAAGSKKPAGKGAKAASASKKLTTNASYRRLPPVSDFARGKRHPDFETFDSEDLELFDQGYPELVLLDDHHPHNKQVDRWVETAVSAVDQLYRVVWPTEVALAYVHTFPTLTKTPAFAKKLKAFNKLDSKQPTLDTARVLLREFIHGNDVYSSWKAPPAFYILEHFLGAEAVASAILERFAELDAKKWAQVKNYDHARIALGALGYLLLRMDEPARTRVLAARDKLLRKRPNGDRLTQHLRYLPDRPIDLSMDEYSSDGGPWFMSDLTVSSEPRWKSLEPYGPGYVSVRALYLEGPDGINDADLSLLLDGISKASMLEEIDTFGRIKHPSSVRRVLAFGKFKSMVNEVRAWKEAHAAYVKQVLPIFASDPFVQKGLQGLDPNAKPIKKAKDPMAATEKLLEAVEKALPKAFPSQAKVTALIQKAADEAREIARLDGQDYPEVYFVNLWAEFPFSLEVSDEQHELLSNAYEAVIIDGE